MSDGARARHTHGHNIVGIEFDNNCGNRLPVVLIAAVAVGVGIVSKGRAAGRDGAVATKVEPRPTLGLRLKQIMHTNIRHIYNYSQCICVYACMQPQWHNNHCVRIRLDV